jgi:addiction module HigA family antidote
MSCVIPDHPGEILKSCIDVAGKSVDEVAKAIGVSRQSLYRILAGQCSVTAEMALRFEKAFGHRAEMWMRLQGNYDLAVTFNRMEDILKGIPTVGFDLDKEIDNYLATPRPILDKMLGSK